MFQPIQIASIIALNEIQAEVNEIVSIYKNRRDVLVNGLNKNVKHQTLLGVTGSGKTFTIANVIKEINRPTLVLSHNKTLAAQLYSKFRGFFPNAHVELKLLYMLLI